MIRHLGLAKVLIMVSLIAIVALAGACGGDDPTPTPQLTATATPSPTATAPTVVAPPTNTPRPTPTATPTPRPTPTLSGKVEAKVDRLKVAWIRPRVESNLTWVSSRPELVDKRPSLEYLIGISRIDGGFVPRLAKRWEMVGPDGKSWKIELEKGVEWHGGYGEFTVEDVIHSGFLITQTESLLPDRGFWRSRLVEAVEAAGGEAATIDDLRPQFEIINDHEFIFRLIKPAAEFEVFASENAELMIQSKKYWDDKGLQGYEDRVIGTGPFEYVERRLDDFVLYKSVEDHWRQTPNFKELWMASVPENATRLAMLLTGEVHIIGPLTPDLNGQAEQRGMKVLRSKFPGGSWMYQIGGLYYQTPDKIDLTQPFTDKRVRKAMNMAIDRESIREELLGGKATPLYVMNYHQDLAINSLGFNPEWIEDWEATHGYNPEEARKLIKEAGAEGYEFTFYILANPNIPEQNEVAVIMAQQFEAVGLKPKLVESDTGFVGPLYRTKSAHEFIWPNTPSPISQELMTRFWSYSPDGGWSFESERLDELFPLLVPTMDPVKRAEILQEIGDIWYYEYQNINLWWILAEVVINPDIIKTYEFPGAINGIITHLEYVIPQPK